MRIKFWSCESIALSEKVQSDTVMSVFISDIIKIHWTAQLTNSTQVLYFFRLEHVFRQSNVQSDSSFILSFTKGHDEFLEKLKVCNPATVQNT